jgi:hypothetical protein
MSRIVIVTVDFHPVAGSMKAVRASNIAQRWSVVLLLV